MFDWLKKTSEQAKIMAQVALRTPEPIGDTLIVAGTIVILALLLTHKVKVIIIFS